MIHLENTTRPQPIPKLWAMTTCGESCVVNPSNFPNHIGDEVTLSFVPMSAVEARTGWMNPGQMRPFREVRKGYTRFSEGDVLFAKITPSMENGKVAIAKGLINGVGCGSTEFHVLRPMDGLLRDYLLHFLLQDTFRREAQRHMSGTAGQMRVPVEFLDSATFPLPPLPEQHRIVAEIEKQFTRLDASVASLKRAQANLKRYRSSVLKSACEGKLVPTEAELAQAEGRSYEPASQLLQRILAERRSRWSSERVRRGKYKEPAPPDASDLPDLPEGWKWSTLSQVTDLKGGVTKGQRHQKHQPLKEVPYLRVANVQRGYLDLEHLKNIQVTQEAIDKHRLDLGDILFTEGGDRDKLGRGWVWNGEVDECIHQNHIFRSRLLLDSMRPELISWWGNTFGKDFFSKGGKQTTNLASINLTLLAQFPIPIPPIQEQHRIVAEVERRLSVIQQVEAAVEAGLKCAERLRQSILKQAFSGKLVSQDPNDEPAALLLERIRAERAAAEAVARAQRKTRRRRSRPKPAEQLSLGEET